MDLSFFCCVGDIFAAACNFLGVVATNYVGVGWV